MLDPTPFSVPQAYDGLVSLGTEALIILLIMLVALLVMKIGRWKMQAAIKDMGIVEHHCDKGPLGFSLEAVCVLLLDSPSFECSHVSVTSRLQVFPAPDNRGAVVSSVEDEKLKQKIQIGMQIQVLKLCLRVMCHGGHVCSSYWTCTRGHAALNPSPDRCPSLDCQPHLHGQLLLRGHHGGPGGAPSGPAADPAPAA